MKQSFLEVIFVCRRIFSQGCIIIENREMNDQKIHQKKRDKKRIKVKIHRH
jgi:hypothetical protein